jgi:hypothetical protein
VAQTLVCAVECGRQVPFTGAVGSAEQGTSVSLSATATTAITGGPLDNGYAGAIWVFDVIPPRRHAIRR